MVFERWCSSAKRENSLSHVCTRMKIVSLIYIKKKLLARNAQMHTPNILEYQHSNTNTQTPTLEHRYASWRPSRKKLSPSASVSQRWNQSSKKSYTPKQYRSPPNQGSGRRRKRASTLFTESHNRTDLLQLQEESDDSKKYSRRNRRSPSAKVQEVDDETKTNDLRASARKEREKTSRYVNWKSMSGLFSASQDKNLMSSSSALSGFPTEAQLRASRGLTVSEMVGRTSPRDPTKRRTLIRESDIRAIDVPRHNDTLMRGNAAWTGLSQIATTSKAEKRRILGSHYHRRSQFSGVPPPPPSDSSKTSPPPVPKVQPDTAELESRVQELRKRLAETRESPPPVPTSERVPEDVDAYMERLRREAGTEIEEIWNRTG